jgi:hypothetical protein
MHGQQRYIEAPGEGTLNKTLLRLKEKAPQCVPFIDLYLKDYLSEDVQAPPPQQLLSLVAVIRIDDPVMDARRKLFVAGFLAICIVTDNPEFNRRNQQVFEDAKKLFDQVYGK